MKNKTVTVPIEWFEGLMKYVRIIEALNYSDVEILALIGYIQSAEHIIKGGKDE